MAAYYIYNLLAYLVSRFGLRLFLAFFFLTYPIFLYLLPETGFDFIHYQRAYEMVYFDQTAPLFFRSGARLTAEPGWFLYTGLLNFLTADFRVFLAINFLLTTSIIAIAFKKFEIPNREIAQILALMIPVQFIVIYLWSVRSALPLGLTFLFVAYLRQRRLIPAFLCACGAILIHSQYGLFIIFCSLYYGIHLLKGKDQANLRDISFPILAGIAAGTIVIALLITSLLPLLSFLPTFEIISSKTRYLSIESQDVRITSLLSLVFFPLMLALRWKELSLRREFDVVVIFVTFSLIVNMVFIYNIHLAGRLARASDYFLFGYFVLDLSRMILGRYNTPIILAILVIFPFLFKDLYRLSDFF